MTKRRPTYDSVASNLQWLKEAAGDNFRDMEKRSGVGKSIIQRILSGEQAATVEQAEKLAAAYGLEGWHLLLHNLPHDVAQTKTLSRLVQDYIHSSPQGRDNLNRMAQLEARYREVNGGNGG